MNDERNYLSLRGPVEMVDGCLILQIPLESGGWELRSVAKGISKIVGDDLVIKIPEGLAAKLGIFEGTYLFVDDRNGKFNITVDKETVT